MDEAAAVRRAALGAVGDVTPPALRDDIEGVLADGSLLPGVVALATATAAGASEDANLAERAAGVQLVYDGLRLTRRLAHENPWAGDDSDAADMEILAADVLVARGFRLLAPTDAAERAVEVVRAFGRDQTDRRTTSDPVRFDRQLEGDVLELALVAGATAAGGRATDATELVDDLVATWDGQFPEPEAVLDPGVRERLAGVPASPGAPLNRND